MAAAQSLDHLYAPEVSIKTPGAKKKGAVIGSAPKLSHEGLVAAAKAAEEKAAAEAMADKKAKQLAARKAATAAAKLNRQKQRLVAPGGGIGLQPQPVQSTAAVPAATALQADVVPQMPMPIPQAASAEAASVQGKIHQGKWSKKKQ